MPEEATEPIARPVEVNGFRSNDAPPPPAPVETVGLGVSGQSAVSGTSFDAPVGAAEEYKKGPFSELKEPSSKIGQVEILTEPTAEASIGLMPLTEKVEAPSVGQDEEAGVGMPAEDEIKVSDKIKELAEKGNELRSTLEDKDSLLVIKEMLEREAAATRGTIEAMQKSMNMQLEQLIKLAEKGVESLIKPRQGMLEQTEEIGTEPDLRPIKLQPTPPGTPPTKLEPMT